MNFDMQEPAGRWIYMTHEVDGRLHVGWYRRLPGRRVEVSSRSQVRLAFIESESIDFVARRVLEDLIRQEFRVTGAPLGWNPLPA